MNPWETEGVTNCFLKSKINGVRAKAVYPHSHAPSLPIASSTRDLLLLTMPHPCACQVGKELTAALLWLAVLRCCQVLELQRLGTRRGSWMLLACPSSLLPTSSLAGSSGYLCPPPFSPNWFKLSESKDTKGSWQTGANANRGSKRNLISLGHEAKEKSHRKDGNSMRKRFCYLRDGCILLFCYIKFDMKFDHLTPQIINKGFLIVLFPF